MKPNLILDNFKNKHIEQMYTLNKLRKSDMINYIFWLFLTTIIIIGIIICYDKYKNKKTKY